MYKYVIAIAIAAVFLISGCDSDNSTGKNSMPVDSLNAEISGEITLNFKTAAVNILAVPNDSGQVLNISGELLTGAFDSYTIYMSYFDDKTGKTEIDLAGTDNFTRFEHTLGATGIKTIYGNNISGKINLTLNTKNSLAGTFNFKAYLDTDTTKYIEVKNGIFYYTTDN